MRIRGLRILRCLMAASLLALPIQSFGAVSPNTVLSASIKPADGTTGQILTTGSGVKTGHIQDSAISTSKIVNGAITTNKIANSAVTNAQLADGAVTDSKISGFISGAKLGSHEHDGTAITTGTIDTNRLNVGTTAGTVASGEHNHDSLYAKKVANVTHLLQ